MYRVIAYKWDDRYQEDHEELPSALIAAEVLRRGGYAAIISNIKGAVMQVDLTYYDIELLCALLERASDTETAQNITRRLRAAQGPKSNPENPGDPREAAEKWKAPI